MRIMCVYIYIYIYICIYTHTYISYNITTLMEIPCGPGNSAPENQEFA